MNTEFAYQSDYERYEMINGEIYMMSSPSTNHTRINGNLHSLFKNYLRGKRCEPFDNLNLFLDDENAYIPDEMIVCDPDIVEEDGIHGVPDLVVEIISKSTVRKDKNEKFFAYEKYGVKEYWIVDPFMKCVDVYILKSGKFTDGGHYQFYTDEEFSLLTEKAKNETCTEIKVSLYDDFVVNVKDIFKRVK